MSDTNASALQRQAFDAVNAITDEEVLHGLFDAIKSRVNVLRRATNANALTTIVPGRKYTLHGIRPKHLNGTIVTVESVNATRVSIIQANGIKATVPASCLKPVEQS